MREEGWVNYEGGGTGGMVEGRMRKRKKKRGVGN